MTRLDVVICLGSTPNKDGGLGIVLEERVKLAYKLTEKHKVPLVLSGGKSHKISNSPIKSQAAAMLNYLKTKYKLENLNIILEEIGSSTMHQLCEIKNNILTPNKWLSVGLVTDKVHLRRAKITAEWIFGKKFSVHGFGSDLKIAKDKIRTYSKRELKKYKLSISNFALNFEKGDDRSILEYDKIYRKSMRKHIDNGGNPSTVLKIPGYY